MAFEPTDLTGHGDGGENVSRNGNVIHSNSVGIGMNGYDHGWIPIMSHPCAFGPLIFTQVLDNLLRNPNINSSHLFRADLLYDSDCSAESPPQIRRLLGKYGLSEYAFTEFTRTRTIIRTLVPRNPQLDRSIAQTCYFMNRHSDTNVESIVVCIPHVDSVEELPYYHPTVQSLAYMHMWNMENGRNATGDDKLPGLISLHYRLFESALADGPSAGHPVISASSSRLSAEFPPANTAPSDSPVVYSLSSIQPSSPPSPVLSSTLSAISPTAPLSRPSISPVIPQRALRTAYHLLASVHKHGHGNLAGYTKRVHHDRIIAQPRVQDTYTRLKMKHARRLCDAWVEQTEPSKHVFEDLGIAAFLLELWQDMYALPKHAPSASKPAFPGFVDIGCGNGVLTDILLAEGYHGWGFDARRRKTWAILLRASRARLKQLVLIPSPLIDLACTDATLTSTLTSTSTSTPISDSTSPSTVASTYVSSSSSSTGASLSRAFAQLFKTTPSSNTATDQGNQVKSLPPTLRLPDTLAWHDGRFPRGTFIISNHADELTAWTPLLAALAGSNFLAIPCCSHDLSGARFRAPSPATGGLAGPRAPPFFRQAGPTKSVSIIVAPNISSVQESVNHETSDHTIMNDQVERGDLRKLAPAQRATQPSAYAALCAWIEDLAREAGFVVDTEVLRIPSTRNIGIVGRWTSSNNNVDLENDRLGYGPDDRLDYRMDRGPNHGSDDSNGVKVKSDRLEHADHQENNDNDNANVQARINRIVQRERADGVAWVARCAGLTRAADGAGKSGIEACVHTDC